MFENIYFERLPEPRILSVAATGRDLCHARRYIKSYLAIAVCRDCACCIAKLLSSDFVAA